MCVCEREKCHTSTSTYCDVYLFITYVMTEDMGVWFILQHLKSTTYAIACSKEIGYKTVSHMHYNYLQMTV